MLAQCTMHALTYRLVEVFPHPFVAPDRLRWDECDREYHAGKDLIRSHQHDEHEVEARALGGGVDVEELSVSPGGCQHGAGCEEDSVALIALRVDVHLEVSRAIAGVHCVLLIEPM